MTTDEDLKKLKTVFATKQDIEKFATKDELQKTSDRLSEAIVKTQMELQEVKENMVTKTEFKQALGKLDWIVGELKEVREDRLFHRQEHNDLNEEITKIKQLPVIGHALKH